MPPAVQLQLMREVVAYVCEQMVNGYSLTLALALALALTLAQP